MRYGDCPSSDNTYCDAHGDPCCPMRVCQECDKVSDEVKRVVDPYWREIDNIEVEMDLCPACLKERTDRI